MLPEDNDTHRSPHLLAHQSYLKKAVIYQLGRNLHEMPCEQPADPTGKTVLKTPWHRHRMRTMPAACSLYCTAHGYSPHCHYCGLAGLGSCKQVGLLQRCDPDSPIKGPLSPGGPHSNGTTQFQLWVMQCLISAALGPSEVGPTVGRPTGVCGRL